jgi:DNA-binding response OmpR family regulator
MTDTFANASILLLDSDPLTRAIIHETLERAGFLVVAVGGLGEAVDRLRRMRPDLLIVRPYINSMPGYIAARHLRTRSQGLPVLIVDGFPDDERLHVQSELEDFHTFPKPFAPEELLGKVRDVLHNVRERAR